MANQFLVSSPFTEPGKPLNENNKFVEKLLKCEHHRALMITSDPSDIGFTEGFSYQYLKSTLMCDTIYWRITKCYLIFTVMNHAILSMMESM